MVCASGSFIYQGIKQVSQMTAGLVASQPGCITIGQPEVQDNPQLDRVIVPTDSPKAHGSPWRQRLETVAVILLGFALNISMAISTKWIFVHGDLCNVNGCIQYKFPVAITVIHMIFSWFLCRMYIFHVHGEHEIRLTLQEQISEILPLSICFALSVAMGNMSLKFIYPSFNQMLGSMSPLVTVLLAVLVQGKSFSFKTWISMPVICVGLAICSLKEVNFNALGTFYAVGSMVFRAAKTLIQGKLLQHKMDSISLLYYMAPMSAGILFVLMIFMEGLEPILLLMPGPNEVGLTGRTTLVFLLITSGLNACLLNLVNFLVTSYTSPVTTQVLGNVKSCLSIAISVAIFGNSITVEQTMGVFTCLFGVWIYNQKEPNAKEPTTPTERAGGPVESTEKLAPVWDCKNCSKMNQERDRISLANWWVLRSKVTCFVAKLR